MQRVQTKWLPIIDQLELQRANLIDGVKVSIRMCLIFMRLTLALIYM